MISPMALVLLVLCVGIIVALQIPFPREVAEVCNSSSFRADFSRNMGVGVDYKGRMREGSSRKRLRYAAISVATVLKSFTFSRRISLMIFFSPAMYSSFSCAVLPSLSEPIWTRILSSAYVNSALG